MAFPTRYAGGGLLMFVNAAVRPIALGMGAGIAVGSMLAIPSVMHDLDPSRHRSGAASGLGRALGGFVSNLALPGALVLASAATGRSGLRHGLQAAALGVTMGWWGTKSFGDMGPSGSSQVRTP